VTGEVVQMAHDKAGVDNAAREPSAWDVAWDEATWELINVLIEQDWLEHDNGMLASMLTAVITRLHLRCSLYLLY
jgi:hypothetical protein